MALSIIGTAKTNSKVMRDGGLLPASGTRLGTQTFGQWLAALTALGNLP